MSKIEIGTSQHKFCDVSESWIHQQVHERQKDGQPVCARVTLKSHSVNLLLATPQCAPSHGVARKLHEKEEEIVKIWQKENLNETNWTAGNLYAFVKRAHHLVC
jgi:hypothetical protein